MEAPPCHIRTKTARQGLDHTCPRPRQGRHHRRRRPLYWRRRSLNSVNEKIGKMGGGVESSKSYVSAAAGENAPLQPRRRRQLRRPPTRGHLPAPSPPARLPLPRHRVSEPRQTAPQPPALTRPIHGTNSPRSRRALNPPTTAETRIGRAKTQMVETLGRRRRRRKGRSARPPQQPQPERARPEWREPGCGSTSSNIPILGHLPRNGC